MADVLFLVILTAFFGLCVLLVNAIDRMIEHSDSGSKADGAGEPEPEPIDLKVAA